MSVNILMINSPHKLATVGTFNHNKKAVVSCHIRMLRCNRIRLEKPCCVVVHVGYAKPSLDISYSDDYFLVLVTFTIYNCFQICTDEVCKGTVGSEAGDLSEPAVRRKSHKLNTTLTGSPKY